MLGGEVLHCYYVNNVLMLNCEIHCLGHGSEFETFYVERGVIDRAIF